MITAAHWAVVVMFAVLLAVAALTDGDARRMGAGRGVHAT